MNCYDNMSSPDHGPLPLAANIGREARRNRNFRTALWSGENLQMTLMCIPVGGEIGLESHSQDQIIRIEEGQGIVKIGTGRDRLDFQQHLCMGDAVFVPAGTWHNVINAGGCPLKTSSVYAPPAHPKGTVHRTKADDKEEH